MFLSANYLAINYGVDDTIAKFFTDRQPPADNLYWKDKLLYLRPEAGWIFIPLIADLLFKSGIAKSALLSDNYLLPMEHIGHISAQQEIGLLSKEEALATAISYMESKVENNEYFHHLIDFMQQGNDNPIAALATPYKALHRGDLFLFSLATLHFNNVPEDKLIKCWFALITTLLLFDDADDLEIDRSKGEENAFLESGLTKQAIDKLKNLVKENLAFISTLNKPMASTLDKKFVGLAKKPYISELLNQ